MRNWLTFKNISLSLLGIGIFTAMLVLLLNYKGKYEDLASKPVISRQYEVDQLKVEFNYTGNSTWEYNLWGDLPTLCGTPATAEVIVSESYPEDVKLLLKYTDPARELCPLILKIISETGTFNASPEAEFEFVVEEETLDPDPLESKTYEVDPFKVEVKYLGDRTWEYTLTGELPNPCYSYSIESVGAVTYMYPEQVKMLLMITEPDPGMLCSEVIQENSETGTFSASVEAHFQLIVK